MAYSRNLVWQIMEARENGNLIEFPLGEKMHHEGINIRYLGLILANVPQEEEEKYTVTRYFLLTMIAARVIKNEIRALLRQSMSKVRVPLEAPYRAVIVRYVNWVFGYDLVTDRYWNISIKGIMKRWFHLSAPYTNANYKLRENLFHPSVSACLKYNPKEYFFYLFDNALGVRFSSFGTVKLLSNAPLDEADVVEFQEKVKHMNIVDDAMGSYYQLQGVLKQMEGAHSQATPYFGLAVDKYERALTSNPNNKKLLRNLADCLVRKLLYEKVILLHKEKTEKVVKEKDLDKKDRDKEKDKDKDREKEREKEKEREREKEKEKDKDKEKDRDYFSRDEEMGKVSSSKGSALLSNNSSFTLDAKMEMLPPEIPPAHTTDHYLSQASSIVKDSEVTLQLSDPRVLAVDQYYLRAVDCDSTDSVTLYQYASFMVRCNRAVDRSEEYYLRSLECKFYTAVSHDVSLSFL